MDITELNRILLRSNIAGVVTSSNGIDDANKLVMTKADGTIDSTFAIPNAALNDHIADEAKHLTTAQNSLLDALTASAAELNYSVGVTSDVQTQLDAKTTALNSHIADAAKHLTSGQNSLLDALTASAVELNHSVGVTSAIQTQLDTKAADADLTTHIADATKHLTSGQNALLDAVTVSATELNRLTGVSGNVQTQLDAKAVASDLTTHIADETKHLTSAQNTLLDSLTASAVEINYVDGVTANIQDQLDTKAASSALTTHIADATKHLTSGQNALLDALTASATELNYSVGVTSAVQTQLDSKAVGTDLSTHIADNSKHLTSGQNALLDALTPTATELNYVDGVTSAIQTQLDAKASVTVLNDAITDLEAYADAKVDNIPDWDAPSQTVAPSQEAVLEMIDLFKMSKITYDPANKGEQVLTIGDIATELEAADSNNAVTLITPATLSVVVTDALVDAAAHIANTSNPHSVTKTQVGLGNCDNTSDVNKPISTLTQTALDLKATASDLTTHIADETKHLTSAQNTLLDALTATAVELNYVDGVTSAIQTQLNDKASNAAMADRLLAGNNLADLYDPAEARTNLGLSDGALLPLSSQVQAEAGVHTNSVMNPLRTAQAITAQTATPLAGKLAIASNLSDLNNPSTARTNLGLAIGSNVQAYSANLTTYAGIAPSANVQSLLGAADHNAISDMLNLGVADDAQFGTIQVNSILTTLAQFTGDFIGTLSASTLTSVRSWLLPDADGLLVSAGDVGTVTNTMLAGDIALSKLSITGTPNGAQFLRDDGTWQAISSGITIGSTEITIGSTAITGGTSGRLLTSGTTVGELTLGTGVSTWLGTPTLANLNSAVSDADLAAIGSANQFASAQRIGSASGDYLAIGSSATRELRLSSNAFSLGTASWLLGQYDSGTLVSPASSTVFWEMTVAIRGNAIFYGDLTWNSSNLRIAREGNYHAFLREGTNANRWSVANTYTSATNYEAFVIDWQTTANTARIGTVKGSGGGTARQMIIQTNGTERIRISATGEIFMTLPTSAGTTGSLWNDSGTVKVAP